MLRTRTGNARACTRCGKAGATERHDDAAGVEHWFHPECWLDFRWWLAGHDEPRPRGSAP